MIPRSAIAAPPTYGQHPIRSLTRRAYNVRCISARGAPNALDRQVISPERFGCLIEGGGVVATLSPAPIAHDRAASGSPIIVGTRGSALAMWQTNWALDRV